MIDSSLSASSEADWKAVSRVLAYTHAMYLFSVGRLSLMQTIERSKLEASVVRITNVPFWTVHPNF